MPSHLDKPNIFCIPPEILEKIFSYLDTENLLVCAQVCKMWECICMPTSPLQRPSILGRIFLHLDRKTLMRARLVCKFWKTGLDNLTLKDAVILSGQTFICSEEFLHTIPAKSDNTNPFPSRTVRMSFVLPTIPDIAAARTAVIRSWGLHIKFINMKINTFFTKPQVLATVVSNIAQLLPHLPQLEGLSLGISCLASNFHTCSYSNFAIDDTHSVKHFLGKRFTFPVLTKLKALRLVAWDFSSEETEWLVYEILRHAPNLQLFDPDYFKGYSKFCNIFSQPANWPFQLSILKLAVPARLSYECIGLLHQAGYPLTSLHLDILEFDWEKCPKAYSRVLQTVLKSCETTLRSLSLSFYESSKYIPSTVGMSSLIRNIVSNYERVYMRYSYLKISRLHPRNGESYSCSKLKHLKLRGFKSSLDFLKELKHLSRLILLDYDPERENLFNCGSAFFMQIPTLRELYTPVFGSIEASSKEFKMMEEKYLRVYLLM